MGTAVYSHEQGHLQNLSSKSCNNPKGERQDLILQMQKLSPKATYTMERDRVHLRTKLPIMPP